jgi:two-component system chemotaxis response regulator CheB
VVIGASAGGVGALVDLVGALPHDLDASVLVVLHLPPTAHSALPQILARHARLRVQSATDGVPLLAGHVYVAPPDLHLTVDDGIVVVGSGPREDGHRPSVNTLFRSAARHWGARAIAVVLSGSLNDGAAGVIAIKQAGGVAMAQHPDEAAVGDMPRHAIETGATDAALGVAALAERIVELTSQLSHDTGSRAGHARS